MEVLHARCCGIDLHKRSITVCVLIRESGRKEQKHLREFATTTSEILNCADWLQSLGVTHVAMESTGVYWRPVWNLLEGQFDLLLANATHMRNVPGPKTDIKDSEWIAQLLQHGLLKPSFVPNTVLRDLRELSRDRTSLVAERSRLKNRIQKILEEANIKLGSVASDVLGKSGRAMLTAMVEGQENPQHLADLALGQLRLKIPQLVEALRGASPWCTSLPFEATTGAGGLHRRPDCSTGGRDRKAEYTFRRGGLSVSRDPWFRPDHGLERNCRNWNRHEPVPL